MGVRISYCILFLLLTARLFCQDTIVKKDSTKIISKLLEVRINEITYHRFDYIDGPIYIINKTDVAYILYSNGLKEVFNNKAQEINSVTISIEEASVFVNDIPPKGSQKKEVKIGDYINFNLQLGAVINTLAANYKRKESELSHTSSEDYSASSLKYICNFNFGFNFLFGKSPYIKHIIGVNYLRSTGEYNYRSGSLGSGDGYGGYTNYSQDFHYLSKIDFINIVTGLRFKVFKKIYIEPLISFNAIVKSNVWYSGTSTTTYISGGPNPAIYKTEIDSYSNKKVDSERTNINSTISLCPKISYEFNLKNQKIGIYVSYNVAYQFRLPWYMAGITYYPFKKLR